MKKYKICGKCNKKHKEWTKGTQCKNCRSLCKKQCYQKNKPKYLDRINKYYQDNKEEKLNYAKQYRNKNKNKCSEYFSINAEKIYKQRAKREKQKRNTDIGFRIQSNLRKRLYRAITTNKKYQSTLEYLGCSIEELKIHLEKQFKKGMTWNNYGKWHIDHIKPCASFDLSLETEQKICFHYTNLQPLWAIENIKKSNKISTNI
jgi:hypothetical protein